MSRQKQVVVKIDEDILCSLKRKYPDYSNPLRLRMMFQNHQEMEILKSKITKAGQFLYGKKPWNNHWKK